MASPTLQSAFTIITPLARETERDALELLVDRIDPFLSDGERLPLRRLGTLHYCSWVLIAEEEGSAPGSYLAFEGNVDGPVRPFLSELEVLAGDVLREIYAHCEGFDGTGSLVDYWSRHDIGPGTWYVGWRGRSVEEILREEALRHRIEDFLDTLEGPSAATPRDVRAAIQAWVAEDAELAAWAEDPPRAPFAIRVVGPFVDRLLASRPRLLLAAAALLAVIVLGTGLLDISPGVTLGALAAVVLLAVLLYRWLRARVRRLERSDPQAPGLLDPERHTWTTAREDLHLQNHLCIRTVVKDGRFRMRVLRLALGVVGLAHRLYFNRGRLGGIPSIHFARWVVLEGRRDLVFFSNYDGSFEGYLGDFVDGASVGLNSIWSNTHGYPRTYGLFGGGARDERRFKNFARNSQHRTLCWYAAYPHLSVQNIEQNRLLREGLFRQMERDADVEAWLRRL